MLSTHPDGHAPGSDGDAFCRPEQAVDRLSHLVIVEATSAEVRQVVSALALVAVPASDCAVSTVAAGGHGSTPDAQVFASTSVLCSLARAELDLAEGPARSASERADVVRADDLRCEPRWPRWSRRAAALGVRSVLATPLGLGGSTEATLLWISDVPGRFGPVHERAARHYAAAAGPALHSAAVAEELRSSRSSLEAALTSRATIDQAIGILVARGGVTPAEAWRRLRSMSQREHVKVAEIARRTVEEASRRHRRGATPARDAG